MRRFVFAAALLALGLSIHVEADAKALAWGGTELTALLYTRTSAAPRNFMGPQFAPELILLRPHLSETGELASGGYSPGDFVLRVACAVSGKAPGKSRAWQASFDNTGSPAALSAIPDVVKAGYTVKSVDGDMVTYEVSAAGDDGDAVSTPANPRMGPLTIKADAVFDTVKGRLHSVKGIWLSQVHGTDTELAFEYQLNAEKTFADRVALNKAVEKAIEAGLKAIDGDEKYWARRGDLASLAAYTYLHGGRALSDPMAARALTNMLRATAAVPFVQMYHAGAQALAIEAKYIGEAERKLVSEGKSPSEFKRALTKADAEQMKVIVDWIAARQSDGLFSYGQNAAQAVDLSNTQFAALALAAASRCGVELPAGLVREMGIAMAGFQQAQGPEVWRVKERKKNGKWEYERYADQARGFSYGLRGAPTGSMTGAGTCTMLLLLDIYEAFSDERRKLEMEKTDGKEWARKLQESANCGIAWLQANYTVTRNPGSVENFCYYLYALERVGAFAPTEFIGEHTWYTDGALTLLLKQDADGSWDNFEDTCFAVLFLSRATTPTRRVLTGK